MVAFLVRRLLVGLLTVFAVATLAFVLVHAAPGEPYGFLIDDARLATPEQQAALRARYALDQPVSAQYARYLSRLVRGDLGESFRQRRPVGRILRERLPRTLLLMGTALLLGFGIGIVIGAWQARHRGTWRDRIAGWITVILGAIPDFWIGIALLLIFALKLRWFPVTGMTDATMYDYMSPAQKVRDIAWHLVLPATSLIVLVSGVVARHQRAAVLDVLPEDFLRTARAKGVGERALVYRHALRNALLPTITLFGLALPALVGGAVFVENIFSWPGLGTLAIEAIANRDYEVILGVTILASTVVVVAGIVTDLAYAWADPRTRRG